MRKISKPISILLALLLVWSVLACAPVSAAERSAAAVGDGDEAYQNGYNAGFANAFLSYATGSTVGYSDPPYDEEDMARYQSGISDGESVSTVYLEGYAAALTAALMSEVYSESTESENPYTDDPEMTLFSDGWNAVGSYESQIYIEGYTAGINETFQTNVHGSYDHMGNPYSDTPLDGALWEVGNHFGYADGDYQVDGYNDGYSAGYNEYLDGTAAVMDNPHDTNPAAQLYSEGWTWGYNDGNASAVTDSEIYRQQGYDDGYSAGYYDYPDGSTACDNTTGFAEYEAGWDEGYQEGWRQAESEAESENVDYYEAGRSAGYTAGHDDYPDNYGMTPCDYAYDDPEYENGWSTGYDEGWAAAEAENPADYYEEGYNDGLLAGYNDYMNGSEYDSGSHENPYGDQSYDDGFTAGYDDGWNYAAGYSDGANAAQYDYDNGSAEGTTQCPEGMGTAYETGWTAGYTAKWTEIYVEPEEPDVYTTSTGARYRWDGSNLTFLSGTFELNFFDNPSTSASAEFVGDKADVITISSEGGAFSGVLSTMFGNLTNCTSIDLSAIDTSQATGMWGIFTDCTALTSLDLSGWDTSNVTIFGNTFYNCSSLTSLDVSGWDVSSGTGFTYMFGYCTELSELDLTGWDPVSATNMQSMFFGCESLTSLDVSGWDTHSLTHIGDMFRDCSGLTSLDLSGWDTQNIYFTGGTFFGCTGLSSLDLSGWDTSAVTDMQSMFYGCESLEAIPGLSGFDTHLVTNMSNMFNGCKSLLSLDLSGFDNSSVTDIYGIFGNCESLTTLDARHLINSNITSLSSIFQGCKSLTYLDVGEWDTSRITSFYCLFDGCESLEYLDVSGWDTSIATEMGWMFGDCKSLTTLDVSGFDTSSVQYFNDMFNGCESLTVIDVSGFDTSSAVTLNYMFNECRSVTELDVADWDISNVTDINSVFQYCESLTDVDVSRWDTSSVTMMEGVFAYCTALEDIDVSGWDTSNAKSMWGMFGACMSLTDIDVSNFDTGKVQYFTAMFALCPQITELDISNFDVSSVQSEDDVYGMFGYSTALRRLTLPANVPVIPNMALNSGSNSRGWVVEGTNTVVSENTTIHVDEFDDDIEIAYISPGRDTVTTYVWKERDLFVGHTLSLSGDIGLNFYLDVTEDEINTGDGVTVHFERNIQGNVKTSEYKLSTSESLSYGGRTYYKSTCWVPAAEMTYNLHATVYIDGVLQAETDDYTVRDYSDEVLDPESEFSVSFVEAYGGTKYSQLTDLVTKLLDYGAKAQEMFNRKDVHLANEGLSYSMEDNDNGTPITDAITVKMSDMNEGMSEIGLEYIGSSTVYMTKTTLRHYYKVIDSSKFTEAVRSSANFTYGSKNGTVYFEKANIGAPHLDKAQAFTINGKTYNYSVLDYSKRILDSTAAPQKEKDLAVATYWYCKAAKIFFDVE